MAANEMQRTNRLLVERDAVTDSRLLLVKVLGGSVSGAGAGAVNVRDSEYGAVGDGVVDDSDAFIAAAAALPNGGIVFIPPGKYVVEGLPIRDGLYWSGAGMGKTDGSTGTYLSLPASPSSHMFIWDGAATGFGGGVSGCYLYGGNTVTYDCIDVSASTQMQRFCIEQNMIRGFRRGYSGSADDRSVLIQFNNFWNCTVGVYVPNNHPQFTGWNDYRDCTYGIQGQLVDAKVVGQNFAYCDYGVAPINTTNYPGRVQFNGCSFAFCAVDGLIIGPQCVVSGCLIIPPASGGVSGIRLIGGNSTIEGCVFDSDGGVWSEGCISMDPDYRATAVNGTVIAGNSFRVESTTVIYHKASAAGRDISSLTCSNNTIYDCGSLVRRSGNSFGTMAYSTFNGNTFRYEGSTLTSTLTGTITFTNGSATVTGVGSAFTTELRLGDWIRLSTDADTTAGWRRVSAIASDTSLTLSAVYGETGGAGTGYATRDVIYITNNNTVGNVICNNSIAIYSATPGRAGYGIGGQLGQSTVVGNYVRRGLGAVDTASSGSAQIANNVNQT